MLTNAKTNFHSCNIVCLILGKKYSILSTVWEMSNKGTCNFFYDILKSLSQVHERVLYITNYRDIKNQNHNEISPHTC